MKNLITYKQGFYFPKPFLYLAYTSIAIGIVVLFENFYTGAAILIASGIIAFTPYGIQLKVQDQLYRKYVSVLGIKTGKWKSVLEYDCIRLLGKNISETTYGASTPISTTTKEKMYDVLLLNNTQNEKLLIKRFRDLNEAKAALHSLAKHLNLQII